LLADRANVAIYDPKVDPEQIRLDFAEGAVCERLGIAFDDFVSIHKSAAEAVQV